MATVMLSCQEDKYYFVLRYLMCVINRSVLPRGWYNWRNCSSTPPLAAEGGAGFKLEILMVKDEIASN